MSDVSIFAEALAISDIAAREDYLKEACAGNKELRREVEALLSAHEEENPLDHPPEFQVATELTDEGPPPAEVGDTIGPYRLMEQIGEGGFGLVFVAEQHEPVRRKVALKVLKPGMDTRDIVARFEAERQALALMDHPNIAKVLDAGSTPNGRPYFVMELVKGIPINQYCDEQRLSPPERLELFAQVCQAVQHAHQKGIIHRDIKPTNVLVTVIDGKPVPKVIDFGVAKAVGQNLTERTIYTRFAQLVGTPLYMSPEQAQLSGVDVDTRSDIYALGVLLYELLTGTTPFDSKRFRTAALEEIRRIIREEDPPRPSHRLSSLGETLPSISANRKTEPTRLPGLVRGELDWIVMKCLEKDRDRRYETANGLARDVQRYLSGEAVEACPPTLGYRLRKAYRKHRGTVLTTLSFATVLLVATGVSVEFGLSESKSRRQSEQDRIEAIEARKEADHERDKATFALAAEKTARESLARLDYARSIQLAYQYWRDGNVAETARLVDAAPPQFRDWEWDYLHRLCHSDLLTLNSSSNQINSAKFSRDGSKILTADDLGEIKIWDSRTGELLKSLPYTGNATHAEFSQDESQVFAQYRFYDHTPGHKYPNRSEFLVWDVETAKFEKMAEQGIKRNFIDFRYERGELRIITTHNEKNGNAIKVWDPTTDKWEQILELEDDVKNESFYLWFPTFSPDSSLLIAARANKNKNIGEYIVWNTNTRRIIYRIPVTEGRPLKAHWSQDGSLLALSIGSTGTKIVDAERGETIQTLEDQDAPKNFFANFSPDGTRILSCTSEEVVTIWDVETGKALKQLKGHTDTVRSAEFSPDGSQVLTASRDGTVKIWDAETNNGPLLLVETNKRILPCPPPAFSPDNSQIAFANGAVLKISDATNGKILHELPPLESRIRGFQFFPDGENILIDLSVSYQDTIRLIVFNLTTLERRNIQVDAAPTSAAAILSPNGKFIAVGDNEFRVNLINADSGKVVQRLVGHTGIVFSASFSPDSKRLVTSGNAWDKTARVWNVYTGKELVKFEGHGKPDEDFAVWNVCFSPDGTRGVSLADRNTIVWNAQTGEKLVTLEGITHGHYGSTVAYSPNGSRIIVSNEAGVSIWDADAGNLLLNLRSTTPNISREVGLSPDGTRIAINTKEGVEIFDSRPFPHTTALNP